MKNKEENQGKLSLKNQKWRKRGEGVFEGAEA